MFPFPLSYPNILQIWSVLDKGISKLEAAEVKAEQRAAAATQRAVAKAASKSSAAEAKVAARRPLEVGGAGVSASWVDESTLPAAAPPAPEPLRLGTPLLGAADVDRLMQVRCGDEGATVSSRFRSKV